MTINYEDEVGWARIDDVLSPERAFSITAACLQILDGPPDQLGPTDKPNGGTLRLGDVHLRVSAAAGVVATVEPLVAQIIHGPHRLTEVTFRCPQPGFGGQQLHADTLPRLAPGLDNCATVIVPLVGFTETNGATRLVPGSHHRPDLQRQAGKLAEHRDEIRLLGPAGCGFIFSGHVLHSGTKNSSGEARPALQLVFRTSDGTDGDDR
jgi:ectoine hydroxylase-related dioxygenase (phytanoyl-CoA dioxygenase family)